MLFDCELLWYRYSYWQLEERRHTWWYVGVRRGAGNDADGLLTKPV